MDINIIGHKIETESQYFRKPKPVVSEDATKFFIFVIGIVVGFLITFIVTTGGMR